MIINKQLRQDEILFFLEKMDSYFTPEKISKRIDLFTYSKKLADKSIHFYLKDEEKLIGMTCCYMNDLNKLKAFISIICIDPEYYGKGIGSNLTLASEKVAFKLGFKFIESEVHINNSFSIKMYQRLGYLNDRNLDEMHFIMQKKLGI